MSVIDQAYYLINQKNTSGKLYSQISPFDPELIVNTAFHDNGNIHFRFTIKNGRLHGLGRVYYDNMQIKEEAPFHKGVLHGASRGWYKSGQIRWEINYVNNHIFGLRRHWYETSQLLSECHYKNNQPDGVFSQWHKNGQVKECGAYLEGKRHGIFKEFSEEGLLLNKNLFVRDVCYTGKLKRLIKGKLDCRRIAAIKSGAIRRILLEEVGYARFVNELDPECIEKEDEQELLKINWHKDEEPIYVVKVKCPSTNTFYTLRVPPFVQSIQEAIAWTFSVNEKEYLPQEET